MKFELKKFKQHDFYPFVNNIPCGDVANCCYCEKYKPDDICETYSNEPHLCYIGCGPVCGGMSLNKEGIYIIYVFSENFSNEDLYYQKLNEYKE